MRTLVVLLASVTAACGLAEIGDGSPTQGGDAGRDATPIDARPSDGKSSMDAPGGGPESGAFPDAASDHAHPSDAKEEPDAGSVGPAGFALDFDGTNYVQADPVTLPSSGFTLEAWILPTVTPASEVYVASQDEEYAPQQEFRFGLVSGGQLFFTMTDSGGSSHGLNQPDFAYSLISPGAVETGIWTHVAVTQSGASFVLLINESQVAAFNADASFAPGANVHFRVAGREGGDGTSLNGGFDGRIDEVRLWNGPESNASVEANMGMEITASGDLSQLVLYYRFDDGKGTSAIDTTGKYDGSLVSTTKKKVPDLPLWVLSTAF